MMTMYNPKRMKIIENATVKLAHRINSLCPVCTFPGFGVTEIKPGLPCQWCHFPTRTILSHIYTCQKCSYTKEEKFPNGKRTEDPMYCDVCNP